MGRSSGDVHAAAGLIGLATGARSVAWSSFQWRDAAALASRERCIALAWLRSSDIIGRYAEADISLWWRDLALRTLARGHAHVDALTRLTTALSDASVRCAVLKGAPLSAMLYGEPGARASADLDLWIPGEDRARAREVLLAEGWQHSDGAPPGDEAYRTASAHGDNYLELHSSLLHSRLNYLPFPDPETASLEFAGSVLPVMTGPLLPAYLAVQIARHRFTPVLWLLDFRALWDGLDSDGRALARWTAQRCRADRYLDWVLRRTARLEGVLRLEVSAVRRLGLLQERRDVHPMWREIRLAPFPDGPLRAARAWLAPPWATRSWSGPIGIGRRIRRHWRTAISSSRDHSRTARVSGIVARDVRVAGEHLLRVAREISLVGGRMWITATGTSMHPTVAPRDRVLIEPPSRVKVGDIVLVDSGGSPLLHRIVHMGADQIRTRGDSRFTEDAPLRRGNVVARAVRVRRGDREWSLEPSTWRRLRLRVAAWRGLRIVAGGPSGRG